MTELSQYTPPAYSIATVDLHITLHPTATQVVGTLHIAPQGDTPQPLLLNGHHLQLQQVLINNAPAPYTLHDDGTLELAPLTSAAVVQIHVTINPSANTELEGLYRSNTLYCTQCEPHGFRHIMYFIDRPDVLSVYTVTLIGDDSTPILLSNGNLVERGTTPEGLPMAIWHDPFAKPCYLFALAAGDLAVLEDTFTTRSGKNVLLQIYSESAYATRCDFAMQSLKNAMRWDEDFYNLEYDLDRFMILAVSDFNMGAMENKGLNIFNIKYIAADMATATDADYEGIEAVVAHEYFHNYTGNRVTCREWFQLCLKEGLTVYRDQEFSATLRGAGVKRLQDAAMLRQVQFAEDAGALAHAVRPQHYAAVNNLYTATVYEKGAEICRMLATTVGEEAFRAGVTHYLRKHDGTAATVEQFLAALSESTGHDLTPFMTWYQNKGTPLLHIAMQHNGDGVTLTCTQRMANAADTTPRPIPLRVGFMSANGDTGHNSVHLLTAHSTTLHFSGIDAQAVPSLLRGFSAPVRLEYTYTDADLLLLMQHDADDYNRLYAAEVLATRLLLAPTFNLQHAQTLCAAMLHMAQRTQDSPATRAYALQLPALALLMQQHNNNNVQQLFERREQVLHLLATHGQDLWRSILAQAAPTDTSAQAAEVRALRNAALTLYNRCQWHEGTAAYAQYTSATTMTDRMAALRALVAGESPHRETALAHFFAAHAHDATVIDKWFAVQAVAPRANALSHVQQLAQHADFNLANPNRARALWGSFAHGNLLGFCAADGAGFAAVAHTIAQLDAINPQGAARLASAFEIMHSLTPALRVLAQQALQTLQQQHTLSADTADIVQKLLQYDAKSQAA